MKRLIYTILVVFIIALIPSLLYWSCIRLNLQSVKKLNALEYALHQSNRHDIVFVGSSRVIRHVNPFIIDSLTGLDSYVLGVNGMGIVESNMLMNVYLRGHPKPRIMVINTDYNIFFTDGPLFNITDYYPYLDDTLVYSYLSPYKSEYSNSIVRSWMIFLRLIGTTDYERGLALMPDLTRTWYPPNTNKKSYKGFLPVDHLWTRASNSPTTQKQKVIAREMGFTILKEMVATCKQKDILPVFLYTTQHQKADSIFTNQKDIMNRVKHIADSLQVPFLNYEDLYIRSDEKYFIRYSMFNKTSDFFNYSHLNSLGANVLSKYIAADLNKYIHSTNTP